MRKYGLTEQPNLTKLLTKARTLEATATQIEKIESKECAQTNRTYKIHVNKRNNQRDTNSKQHKTQNREKPQHNQKCKNCGNPWHVDGRKTCPAHNITCYKCKKQGHFAQVCLSATSQNTNRGQPTQKTQVNCTTERETNKDDSDVSFKISNSIKQAIPSATVNLNGRNIQFIIDTGSSVNIINHSILQMLEVDLQPNDRPIFPIIHQTR